jgi:prophage DNA circulation protein
MYATMAPLPAVVLAQRLYQDPSREAELVARVGAVHPGFMPLSGQVAAT